MKKIVCSRCGKPINDLVVHLENKIEVLKVSETGVFFPYGNLSEPTSEYLCSECFDRYCNCLDQLNKDYEGEYLVNMVDVVDDIQYGVQESTDEIKSDSADSTN